MDDDHKFFVYEVVNEQDGSVYVGMTSNPKLRWRAHLERAFHPLTHAMVTHGTGSFAFHIVETHASKEAALIAEEQRIKGYLTKKHSLYNIEHTPKERRPRLACDEKVCSSFVWNGRLHSSRGRYYAKYKDDSGKWRNKYVPTSFSTSLESALAWFQAWLSRAQG
jgi:predicted GIY-YIG superfamily endonuclease